MPKSLLRASMGPALRMGRPHVDIRQQWLSEVCEEMPGPDGGLGGFAPAALEDVPPVEDIRSICVPVVGCETRGVKRGWWGPAVYEAKVRCWDNNRVWLSQPLRLHLTSTIHRLTASLTDFYPSVINGLSPAGSVSEASPVRCIPITQRSLQDIKHGRHPGAGISLRSHFSAGRKREWKCDHCTTQVQGARKFVSCCFERH